MVFCQNRCKLKSVAMRAYLIVIMSAAVLAVAGAPAVVSQGKQSPATGEAQRPNKERQIEPESLSHNADSAQECAGQFKAADLNNDGSLSKSEIGNAKSKLPAGLASQNAVSRNQFMAACSKGT
jgi:hypothetical protein